MSATAAPASTEVNPAQRLEMLFDELSELTGQRNAIDARIVEIVAEIDQDGLWGATGARSINALVAWKTGITPHNAEIVVAVARRLEEFPRCAQGMREGRLSLDQVGVIAEKAGDGSDAHYAELAAVATVDQLRTAVKLEPGPQPQPEPEPQRFLTKTETEHYTTWRIRLPRLEAAKLDAGLRSHHDALVADWKHHQPGDDKDQGEGQADSDHDHGTDDDTRTEDGQPPFPNSVDAFMSLIEAGWDTDVARRPHGQHTTVIVHLNLDNHGDKPTAALHLGPLLTDEERRYLLCEATFEAWFERDGQPIGAARTTRQISRRLRRALEHRDRCCVVPGCGATRGLHAHHIRHWEGGGPTELSNLALVCPYHHRAHHQGHITITGPAHQLTVTDSRGRSLHTGSLARTPTKPPPDVPPCPGPTGERADWWWYQPFQPQAPPTTN
ncbi:DUF222 domain-containing protein [Mycobacterium sp. TNTM28]|uniref:DUF222 domain-containing protein n=1 Tax=[Mycobacterium] fortunisiensis TaxID=2600579 RepID=A0ABS6KND1_9MYCO|nr:HNH endonuclease signature motif containing protein [[Mycobacterium] fortunisiensis]MBU9765132.1 DUF222 domain-containing protein [[Mycobacterium] fortunisiensis]